eukprot:9679440-Alexandrium_andersonii.AAC.1
MRRTSGRRQAWRVNSGLSSWSWCAAERCRRNSRGYVFTSVAYNKLRKLHIIPDGGPPSGRAGWHTRAVRSPRPWPRRVRAACRLCWSHASM